MPDENVTQPQNVGAPNSEEFSKKSLENSVRVERNLTEKIEELTKQRELVRGTILGYIGTI